MRITTGVLVLALMVGCEQGGDREPAPDSVAQPAQMPDTTADTTAPVTPSVVDTILPRDTASMN